MTTRDAMALAAASREPDPLLALLVEYERLNTNTENAISRIFAMLTVGAGATGLLISQLPKLDNHAALKAIYLSAPLAYTLLFAMVVQQIASTILTGYHMRTVEQAIGEMTGQERVFQFKQIEVRGLYSIRSGPIKHLLSYGLVLVAIAGAYLGVVGYCIWGMIDQDIPWAIIALAISLYLGANVVAIVALEGALLDSRITYQNALRGVPPARRRAGTLVRTLSYLVTPRLGDLWSKGLLFWIGALAALSVWQVSDSVNWGKIGAEAPLIVGAFLIIDWLTNQTKYMWNDLRDRQDDRYSPAKRHRLLAEHPDGIIPELVAMFSIIRIAAAIAIAAIFWVSFGQWVLLPAVVVLLGLQLVYEELAKRGFWTRWLVASAGYPLRAATGFTVSCIALRIDTHDALPIGLFVVVWSEVYALLFLMCTWRAESESARTKGADPERVRRGLSRFESATALRITVAIACCVVAGAAMVPLAIVAGVWHALSLLGVAPVGAALLVIAFGDREAIRSLNTPILVGAALVAAIALIVSFADAQDAVIAWSISFPACVALLAVFYNEARYEDFIVEINLLAPFLYLVRIYRSFFLLDRRVAVDPDVVESPGP